MIQLPNKNNVSDEESTSFGEEKEEEDDKEDEDEYKVEDDDNVVLLHCGCLSLNPFIEFRIQNNSSSSDVLNIQVSISISPKFEAK